MKKHWYDYGWVFSAFSSHLSSRSQKEQKATVTVTAAEGSSLVYWEAGLVFPEKKIFQNG